MSNGIPYLHHGSHCNNAQGGDNQNSSRINQGRNYARSKDRHSRSRNSSGVFVVGVGKRAFATVPTAPLKTVVGGGRIGSVQRAQSMSGGMHVGAQEGAKGNPT